jgi:hypothetical protein
MAGLADANPALQQNIPATIARDPSSRRTLPSGPCNYRDVAFGACGCEQFWDKGSAELHDELADQPSSNRSTWCVCGHHACFHLRGSRAPEQPAPSVAVALCSTQAKGADHLHLLPDIQLGTHVGAQLDDDQMLGNGQGAHSDRSKTFYPGASQELLQRRGPQSAGPSCIGQSWETPSQASTSGLPGVPSVCKLSRDRGPAADNGARYAVNQSRQTIAGLGLSMMQLNSVGTGDRQQSPTPPAPQASFSEPEIASTRANSIATEPNRIDSPSRGVLNQIQQFNRNLHLDMGGDTIPNTYNPEDFIQSATEVATPSIANTPDLSVADQAVQEGRNLIDTLAHLTSNMQQPNGPPNRPTTATSALGEQNWLTNSSTPPQEQLQSILRAASPQALHKLISYLAPLHNLLSSIPNVANTMRDLGSRLEMLENGSFNYVQPEDLNQTLSMYDDRLVEIEHRMDEHDKHHQAIDADHSSASYHRRQIDVTTSFGSNASLQSTTSSALILAAIDRKDTEMELGNIKDRLETLEAAALPTTFQPWEVEVVLLPWGRELRGIWFSPDEPMHDGTKTTTQDSEEWTQARSSKVAQTLQSPQTKSLSRQDADSSPYQGAHVASRASIFSDAESGWSSEAISDWASGSAEDWLFPKACGSNNLVYKRLQSRGYVRDVTLRGSSARELQATLSHAFGDLLEHLSYTDQDGGEVVDAYSGLRASFIPLRKVLKDSKLRFLSPAEMSSSALWSAQFLAAGVMMRVSGGKKRLYVTQREAYIQNTDELGSSWTWNELRQLPRYQPDQDSQMEGNDEHCQPPIPEADAKETCWQFVETYDAPPPSIQSSFDNHQSVQLSMRPADRQWRRSITPSSILKIKGHQPISPLSENHPRPNKLRTRTASASIPEQVPAGSSKRRFNSSPVKQSSAPQPTSRTPSVSVSRLKRRRTANSFSLQREDFAPTEVQITGWNPTPRLSREPPSPFYSSLPAIARSSSDVTRPSQRSAAVVGKSTPFAYATPHSGPSMGGPGFGGYNNGGDTEPDDDGGDDGEQSWHGVTDGDEDGASSPASSELGPEDGARFEASFSGDDSGFGSDSEDEGSNMSDGTHRDPTNDHVEEEEEEDVFDSLLDVLEH